MLGVRSDPSHSSTPRTEVGSLADTLHKGEDVPGNEERFIGLLQLCKHQWRLIVATVVLLEEAHET
jgi:hypothetical protein